jgi:uroporphyrinogen decarboxylase
MKTNMYKWLDEILASKTKKAMPVLSFPGIQLTNITVPELINDSDLQAKTMKAVADKCDCAASLSMMDLSVESEAFGANVRFSDDEVPTVIGRLIDTLEDVEALKIPKVGDARTGIYIDAIKKAAELITDRPVFAGVIGPFSLSGRLLEMTEIMIKCYTDPEIARIMLDKATSFIIEYIKAYKAVGANGVVIAEPAAGLLSPELCEEFSSKYVKKIVESVQDENFVVVYHNCGNTVPLVDSIVGIGAAAYHFGNAIEMLDIMKLMPKDKVCMGNIDPSSQFRNGTPKSVYKETLKLLIDCSNYSNFVISSGCDIPPMTPWANIDAFFDAVADFYRQINNKIA